MRSILGFGLLLTLALGAACSGNETADAPECTPACGDALCGDDGCGGSCGECATGGTCTDGVCLSGKCGNGVLDDEETCDASADVRCATAEGCEPLSACFVVSYTGSPETCDASCDTTQIVECRDGDGCCPSSCHPGTDRDCAPESCGNGTLDLGETCDEPEYPCVSEAECQPADSCENATLVGYDFTCIVECQRTRITSCSSVSDGCCAEGCSFSNDPDCPPPVCGNGVVEEGETCDTTATGPELCPETCEDNRACTTDLSSGTLCTTSCTHVTQATCQAGDGCCPVGCSTADDSDCANVVCGDGVVDGDEGCDRTIPAGEPGSCPTSAAECDDGDPCTTDSVVGVASDCSARCVNDAIACMDGDSCCPFACSESNDRECRDLALCETLCMRAIDYCVADNAIFETNEACLSSCRNMVVGKDDGQDADTVRCRVHHLADALADPDTHCAHAAEDASEGCVDF